MSKIKLFMFSLLLLFLISLSFNAGAIKELGYCGENITYVYDSKSKSVTIGGSGEMYNYSDPSYSPFGYTDIVSVEIEDGITSIGKYAFYACESLESVVMPDSIATVESRAFESCCLLSEIRFSESLSFIGEGAFAGCESLTDVVLLNNSVSVSKTAFQYCVSLSDVLFHGSIEEIGANAFFGCSNLSKIHIGSDISESAMNNIPTTIAIHSTDYIETVDDCLSGEAELSIYCDVCDAKLYHKETQKQFDSHLFSQYLSDDNFTCMTDGTKTARCERCFKTDTITDTGSAQGHNWSVWQKNTAETCKSEGEKSRICLNCDIVEKEIIPATSHCNSYFVKETAPTCTIDGYEAGYYCPDCKTWIDGRGVIPASGHTGGVAGCSKKAVCSECGEEYGTVNPDNHLNITVLAGKEASCTAKGYTESRICADCKTVTEAKKTIPLKEHTVVIIPGVGVTCTEDGATEGKKCSVCDTVIAAPEIITAKGHREITVSGVEPTCTKVGSSDSKVCSSCNLVIEKAEKIPAKGHTKTVIPGVEATCTKAGLSSGTKCSSCGIIINAPKEIPAKAHSYKTTVVKKATLSANGKIADKCSCGAENEKSAKIIYSPKTFTLSTTAYTYNSNVKTPSVTVRDSKGSTLKKDVDYSVKYESGRKTPGKYTVKLTFKGKYSGTKKLYFTIAPKVTTKVTASQTSSAITLKWNSVTGADGYRVYKYDSETKKYKKVKDVTGQSIKISGLASGTTYKFKVKAFRKDGGTIWGKATDAYAFATNPAPTQIVSYSKNTTSVNLKWKKVSGANGYVIYRYSSGKWQRIKTITSGTKVSCKIGGLKSGTAYKFCIKSYKKSGGSTLWSSKSSSIAVVMNPAAPTLKVTSSRKGIASFKWSNVSGESGYQVYFSFKKDGGFKKLATVNADITKLIWEKPLSGKTYYFKVRSYKKTAQGTLYSAWSNVCAIEIK